MRRVLFTTMMIASCLCAACSQPVPEDETATRVELNDQDELPADSTVPPIDDDVSNSHNPSERSDVDALSDDGVPMRDEIRVRFSEREEYAFPDRCINRLQPHMMVIPERYSGPEDSIVEVTIDPYDPQWCANQNPERIADRNLCFWLQARPEGPATRTLTIHGFVYPEHVTELDPMKLSSQFAECARDKLEELGFDPERLLVEAHGKAYARVGDLTIDPISGVKILPTDGDMGPGYKWEDERLAEQEMEAP